MECLIGLVIFAIVALIVLLIIEKVVTTFIEIPPPVGMLIRLLVGLIVLLRALSCLGGIEGIGRMWH